MNSTIENELFQFHVVKKIIENGFTKSLPLLCFIIAEYYGQDMITDYFLKKMVKHDGCCEWFHGMY